MYIALDDIYMKMKVSLCPVIFKPILWMVAHLGQIRKELTMVFLDRLGFCLNWAKFQGFSLASAIRHSPKIVPDVREFAVQFGQFVRDDFQKCILYGNAQWFNSIFVL